MKNWHYNLGIVLFVSFFSFLFAFAGKRNNARQVENTSVEFLGSDPPFVTEVFVNKMLKESSADSEILTKESIDLSKVEQRIEKQSHIQSAEVYLSVNDELKAKIKQRIPVARMFNTIPFYLDKEGHKMPLTSNYAMRVPLVHNYSDKHKEDLLTLLEYVNNDTFLQKLVVEVVCFPDNDFVLKMRNQSFLIQTGGSSQLDLKFKNFKAFYAKVKKDQLFNKYKRVNLEIANQVICTKV